MSQTIALNDPSSLATVFTEIAAAFATTEYGELLVTLAGDFETSHAGYFAAAQSPGGDAWPPLAPSTIRRKGHDAILVDSDRLVASLAGQSGDSIREVRRDGESAELLFGTTVEYSVFHDRGTNRLPRRVHLGLSEASIDQLAKSVADQVVASLLES